jgi:hypothetical protein
MSADSISSYNAALDVQRAAICEKLRQNIDAALPQATSKLWHAIPVWLVGENVVVGYTARKAGVMLMFWNGQHFDEPELEATGSFHMAQIAYDDAAQIDEQKLAGWLAKAGTSIWDMVGERNAVVAARRKAKAKVKVKVKVKAKAKAMHKPKPKAKARPKTKVKVKAKVMNRRKAKKRAKAK